MKPQVYKQMLEVMMKRGGLYAGMDIPQFYELVEELFSPQQAEMNNLLTRKPVLAADMARETGRPEAEVTALLEEMAGRGLCTTFVMEGKRYYQGLPFMPGIFEYQFIGGRAGDKEKRIAGLIHAYKGACDAIKGDSKITFPLTRVIPVDRKISVKNTIHTYDQVATYINKYDTICVGSCFCRHAAKLRDEDVHDMPIEVCIWFGRMGESAVEKLGGRKVSKEEAKKILDVTEEAGLVHMSRNTSEDIDFMCNCDRWHCDVIKGVLRQPKPGLIFNSGFQPHFDKERCIACETCIGRCPPQALTMGAEGVPVVDLDRCFGCAVCATGCDQQAIEMGEKPGFPEPPRTVQELIAALKARATAP